MAERTLRWAGARDADGETEYVIRSDQAARGVYAEAAVVGATDRGDGEYGPYVTALGAALGAAGDVVELVDGSVFEEGGDVMVGWELVRLGVRSGNNFAGCERGVAGSVPAAHAAGTAVAGAHEAWTGDVHFGVGRHVVRLQIVRRQGEAESVAARAVAVAPSAPPDTSHCVVYLILEDGEGEVKAGVPVTMAVAGPGNYDVGVGALQLAEVEEGVTDGDGYVEFVLPRGVATANGLVGGGRSYTMTVAAGTGAEVRWEIEAAPDVDGVNVLEV